MATQRTLQTIVKGIRKYCEANTNEERIKKYARFFTEGYDAYGLTQELLYAERDRILEKYRNKLSIDDIIELGNLLIQSGKYEEASFAVCLIREYKGQYTPDMFQEIGNWLENGICNWGHTDVLSGDILSYFLMNGIVKYKDMAGWLKSQCKWKRRAVPVVLIEPVKKGQAIKPLLKFTEPLMEDGDRFVHQGQGWFLREAWKKDPEPVETLLLKWKDTAARKIYQYATEKMSKEQKERFRKEKKK